MASLSDRASRGRDPNIVRAAAELALSCLPHAQALNPNEIQRALIQCKEQSQEMLERACLAVESAAKGGGVYPDILFDVARRWYELYEESVQGPNAHANVLELEEGQAIVVPVQNVVQVAAVAESSSPNQLVQLVPASTAAGGPGLSVQAAAVASQGHIPPGAVAIAPIPYTLPPPPGHSQSQMPHHPYIAPYSYVQQIPPNFAHHYSAPHIPLHTHNMHPSYMATYPYASQSPPSFNTIPPHVQTAGTLYHANVSHLRPPPPTAVQVAYGPGAQILHSRGLYQAPVGSLQAVEVAGNQAPAVVISQPPNPPNVQQQQQGQQQQQQQQQQDINAAAAAVHPTPQLNYLMAAYRVGMLAMETLARRVHDDRPVQKYARNPPYGEDVKWLLKIAIKLGNTLGF